MLEVGASLDSSPEEASSEEMTAAGAELSAPLAASSPLQAMRVKESIKTKDNKRLIFFIIISTPKL